MSGSTIECGNVWNCRWNQARPDQVCPLHDPSPSKNIEEFRQTMLWALKDSSEHGRGANLDGVQFPQGFVPDVFFVFPNGGSFRHTRFVDKVEFDGGDFMGQMEFVHTQFLGGVSFVSSIFRKRAIFHYVRAKEFIVSHCSFKDGAFFRELKVDVADFSFATFLEETLFAGTPNDPIFSGASQVLLDSTRFLDMKAVSFSYVDFTHCSLLNVDLRETDLSTAKWPETGYGPWRRKFIYCVSPGNNRVELEGAYRQVRQSYEDRHNYPEAGDFYYGEMEQKRKRDREVLNLLYWASSGYGQHPFHAFLILLALIAFDALLLVVIGVKGSPTPSETFTLLSQTPNPSWWDHITDWWNVAWFHVVRNLTFSRPLIQPRLPFGFAISMLMQIAIAVQVALFALAVNRKFKR